MNEDSTKKIRGWIVPESRNITLPTGLYLVGTPIGNLGDITLRALDTLAAADLVVCEDTRVSGKLLSYFGISKKLVSYNDHSSERDRGNILCSLSEGKVVALISDAGLPLISDPGLKLVQACAEAGVFVTSVPGASSVLTALQLSGLASDAFSFIGFLPSKMKARQEVLIRWRASAATVIAFETAPRLVKALGDIVAVMDDPQVAVVREITKMYEEVVRGLASELVARYEADGAPKGEIVLVIAPVALAEMDDAAVCAALVDALVDGMSTKEAAVQVMDLCGRPKKELYNMALEIKKL